MNKKRTAVTATLLFLLLVGGAVAVAVLSPPSTESDAAAGASDTPERTPRSRVTRRDRVGGTAATPDGPISVSRELTLDDLKTDEPVSGVFKTSAPPPDAVVPPKQEDGPVRIRINEPSPHGEQGALRVIVRDGSGDPRHDAEVQVYHVRDRRSIADHRGPVDAAGRVDVGPLDPGDFYVHVLVEDLRRFVPVEVEAGLVTEVTVDVASGAIVEGELRHREKGPLGEVRIQIGGGPRGSNRPLHTDATSTTTDSDGRFRLRGVPLGTHWIYLSGAAAGFDQRPRDEVTIDSTGILRHDIVLGDVSLEGKVLDASTQLPVAGADVRLRAHIDAGGESRSLYKSVATDSRGHYEFLDLPPGTYKLSVTHDGHAGRSDQSGAVGDGAATRLDIELQPACVVALTVRDEAGSPVIGEVSIAFDPVVVGAGASVRASPLTDEAGLATFARVVPAAYEMRVAAAGFGVASVRTTLRPGRNVVDVVLRRSRMRPQGEIVLEGIMRDEATGQPVAGVLVSSYEGTFSARTDADGRFTWRERSGGSAGAGRPARAILNKDGYGVVFLDVPEEGPLEFDLKTAATVHLHIRKPDGAAYAGRAHFSMKPLDEGGTRGGTGVDADVTGVATYKRILPGRYKLRVSVADYGRAEVQITVQPGENDIPIDLE